MNGKSAPEIHTALKTIAVADGQEEGPLKESLSVRRRFGRCRWHVLVRQITLLSLVAIRIAGWIGRKKRDIGPEGCKIMLTGRFGPDNWILAHLGPLAASKECSRLWMVSTSRVPNLPKVVPIYPPKWLVRVLGATPARLLTFTWAALRNQPHVVGGFYLIANGMIAAAVGRLVGARSLYFCVGGPAEVDAGGAYSTDNISGKMETADPVVERRLLRIVSKFDAVITMGTRAVQFFQGKGVHTTFHVVSGGLDPARFRPLGEALSHDLILIGRLASIKRIDVFLQAVRLVADSCPHVSAVIVGEGDLRDRLQRLSTELGLDRNVHFTGHQGNVEQWLCRARLFVLTSDSEGLSLSLMEAMMCGLPAVVSDVGDLGDLVEEGVNGYLVARRAPALFAGRLVELLGDEPRRQSFSQAARRAAMRYEMKAAIGRWDHILANL